MAYTEIAFAPFPENDVPRAIAYMTRFYQFIMNVHREDFDPGSAARLEVNWWSVHRKLFGNPENRELVEALTDLYTEAYGVEASKMSEAARLREFYDVADDKVVYLKTLG